METKSRVEASESRRKARTRERRKWDDRRGLHEAGSKGDSRPKITGDYRLQDRTGERNASDPSPVRSFTLCAQSTLLAWVKSGEARRAQKKITHQRTKRRKTRGGPYVCDGEQRLFQTENNFTFTPPVPHEPREGAEGKARGVENRRGDSDRRRRDMTRQEQGEVRRDVTRRTGSGRVRRRRTKKREEREKRRTEEAVNCRGNRDKR